MLWQNQDQAKVSALQNSGGDLPTTFADTFRAAWQHNDILGQNYFGEKDRADALNDYLIKIKDKTGHDIASELDYGGQMGGPGMPAHALLQQANDKVNALKKDFPELETMRPEQLDAAGIEKRRKADADFAEVVNRPRGTGATLGLVAGQAATGTLDPINVLSLAVAPEASLGVVASAVRWGLITGGAGIVSEAAQAPYREQVQPGYLASGAPLLNVAEAGLMGAAGGALFPAVANAWGAVRRRYGWPTSVRDAGNIVDSQANVMRSNVYPGVQGEVAHEQALSGTIDNILNRQPVDVSQHITPELEDSVPTISRGEAMRRIVEREQARRAAAAGVEAPELPLARTEAEAAAERARAPVEADVQQRARNAGYDMPAEQVSRVTDRVLDGTPEDAQTLMRNMQISPRQVADAPSHIEAPATEIPTPVTPADIQAPEHQAAVRADLEREVLRTTPEAPVSPEKAKLAAIDARHPPLTLPERHNMYFRMDENTRVVPIDDIISSKTAEENVKGGRNAAKRMAASATGELERRPPITVEQLPDGKFKVVDGNGTLTAAKRYGWEKMPVQIKSAGGIPSLEAKAAPTGGLSMISRIEAPPGFQPSGPQPSTRLEPSAISTQRYAPPSIWAVPRTLRFSEFRVGDIDAASNKHILHGSNDINALLAAAEENRGELETQLKGMVADTPGTHYHNARVKVAATLQKKVMAKGRAPNTITDYLGARVVADTPEALYNFVDKIQATGGVIESEEFIANPKPGGYRGVHLQIGLGDGTSAELQVLPKPVAEAMDEAHAIRDPVKRILDQNGGATPEETAQAKRVMARAQAVMDNSWVSAEGWGSPLPAAAAAPAAAAPIEHAALPNGIAAYSPQDLGVDAERFQFKAGGDEAGVTDRLAGVKKWDPILAGQVLVWVDKDGKPWIVDGHQRLALAKRIAAEDPSQNPQLLARTLREDEGITPADARTMAALKNIAEGTGTAVDAAKIIRDHPERIDDLPPRSELVRQARGLATLSPEAFRLVVNDVVPPNYASIVGRLVPGNPEQQTALLHLLAKTDPANAVQAESIVRQGIEAGFAKAEAGAQGALFGEQEVAESLYNERAKVLDRALKTLRRDKAAFSTIVKEAETLETAGNVLAKDINEQRAITDGQAIQILQTLANRAGPISDALRTAAAGAKSAGYSAASKQFVAAVREAISSGELTRAANGLERGATHVGEETTAGTIDRGFAAEPGQPAAIDAADEQIKGLFENEREVAQLKNEATAASKEVFALHQRGAAPAEIRQAELNRDRIEAELDAAEDQRAPAYEPGAEGKPQAIMPGMEPSAKQLAAARAGPLRGGAEEPGGLFARRETPAPDLFPTGVDAQGRVSYGNVGQALDELEGYKIAAEQLAQCAAGTAEGAAA